MATSAKIEKEAFPADVQIASLKSQSISSSLFRYSSGLVLIAIALADAVRIADPDLWGHLCFGRAVLAAQHHLILRDPYSYSAAGHTWNNHERLAESAALKGLLTEIGYAGARLDRELPDGKLMLIDGHPAENLRRVLDRIESALVGNDADNIQRVGNRISFSAGLFSFKHWINRNPLLLVTSGEIEIEPSGDFLMVDYRLSFSQQFIISTVMVLCFVPRRLQISGQSLTAILLLSAIAWRVPFAGNVAVAVFRFSEFLHQFPRDD